MKILIFMILVGFQLNAAELEVLIYKDKKCKNLNKSVTVELDKMFCESDYMIGKYHMIICLTKGISVVYAEYGDPKCKTPPIQVNGGSQEFPPDVNCHFDKPTQTYRAYNFSFNTDGAFCQYQKCLSDCQKKSECKKKCSTDFKNKL